MSRRILEIDPEHAAARQVLAAIEHAGVEAPAAR